MSTELVKPDQPNDLHGKLIKTDLNQIARMAKKDIDITAALSDSTVDNMKAFLIIYSRSQLNRVVTLTNRLNQMEDMLISKATSGEEIDTDQLMSIIRVIQKSLDSALGLIKQVTTDESYLQVIVNNTRVVNNTLNQYNVSASASIPALANQDSREKVRTAITTILGKVAELEDANGVKELPDGNIQVLSTQEE